MHIRKLTIFTPCYNGERHLEKLHQSLSAQSFQDFEWFIIDDGSTDSTRDIAARLQAASEFPVRYAYQENRGKYIALYNAIQQCRTELFCCVDADMELYSHAIDGLESALDSHDSDASVIGVGMPLICRRHDDLSKTVGGRFQDCTPKTGRFSELTSRYKYHGEVLYLFRTAALKGLALPDMPYINTEKFWTESAFYFPLNKNYKVFWLNVPAGESIYQPGGLTDARMRHEIASPHMTLAFYNRGSIYHPLWLHRIANCCLYISWKRLMGLNDRQIEKIPLHVIIPAIIVEPVYCREFRAKVKQAIVPGH